MQPGDAEDRINFAAWYLSLSDEEQQNFCFSDEANFFLSGGVNSQNIRRYALPKNRGGDGRPDDFVDPKVTSKHKIVVFCGLHSSGSYQTLF